VATKRKFVVVVAGPTAVGKTAVALQLAGELHSEIVSADSRQMFREMSVGTAKPTLAERQQVRHHFIDSHSIHDSYSAARYGDEARSLIRKLHEKHDYVVVCGGSGLYIRALCEGFDEIPETPGEVREYIRDQFKQRGLLWLQQELQIRDPDYFSVVDQKNPHRLMRGLEVVQATGASILHFQSKRERMPIPFSVIKVGLELPREELYARIDERLEMMIDAGLFEEAGSLYPYREHMALRTVGYQEVFGFLDGLYDKEEAVRLLKRNSRQYAKRQLTWFRKDKEYCWFHPSDVPSILAYIARASAQNEGIHE
jgi:tRNA dimethylallyltransferase